MKITDNRNKKARITFEDIEPGDIFFFKEGDSLPWMKINNKYNHVKADREHLCVNVMNGILHWSNEDTEVIPVHGNLVIS